MFFSRASAGIPPSLPPLKNLTEASKDAKPLLLECMTYSPSPGHTLGHVGTYSIILPALNTPPSNLLQPWQSKSSSHHHPTQADRVLGLVALEDDRLASVMPSNVHLPMAILSPAHFRTSSFIIAGASKTSKGGPAVLATLPPPAPPRISSPSPSSSSSCSSSHQHPCGANRPTSPHHHPTGTMQATTTSPSPASPPSSSKTTTAAAA